MTKGTEPTPRGCLARILALVGFAWIGLVLLGGVVGTLDEGFDPRVIGGLGVLIVPALAVIGAGRAIRRRAGRQAEKREAAPSTPVRDRPKKITAPPPPRRSAPPFEPVAAAEEGVAQELPEGLERLRSGEDPSKPGVGHRPMKTSEEMLEEARKRWSSDA